MKYLLFYKSNYSITNFLKAITKNVFKFYTQIS